jgi:WD40 repeat protein
VVVPTRPADKAAAPSAAAAAGAAAAASAAAAAAAAGGGDTSPNAIVFLAHLAQTNQLLSLQLDRSLLLHRFKHYGVPQVPPFILQPEEPRASAVRQLGVHFAMGLAILPRLFCLTRDQRHVLSCGYWDSSFKCSLVESGRTVQSIHQHKDIVTCLALGEQGDVLVTGSRDTTVMVWRVDSALRLPVVPAPLHVLYGHDDEVTCVAVNQDLDVVASGSKDGSIIIHTCRKGHYVRSVYFAESAPLHWLAVSPEGLIVAYLQKTRKLFVFNINGRRLCLDGVGESLFSLALSPDGRYLLTGGEERTLLVRETHNLGTVNQMHTDTDTIRSIAVAANEQYIFLGLRDGRLLIYSLNAKRLSRDILSRLHSIGF